MSFILNDIVAFLNQQGLVSSSYPIYQGYIPDDQDQMMAVFETGGMPPTELGIGTNPRPNERVTFQFRVRGSRLNYGITRAQWLACFNALQDSTLNNASYVYVQAKHYGPIVFNDDRGRSNFISNFNAMRLNEATPPAFVTKYFSITPSASGPVLLTPSNSGSLINPVPLGYGTPPAPPTITSVTPGNGKLTVCFTAGGTGGSAITSYSVTCGSTTVTGSSSPIAVTGLTNGSQVSCTVTATNFYGTSLPSSVVLGTPATPGPTYTFTGPIGGLLYGPSTNFTVTPSAPYTGTITITPSGGGLTNPIVLTFSNSSTPQTFTITPIAVGPIYLNPTNSGGLTDAVPRTYSTPPINPSLIALLPGNGQVAVIFSDSNSGGLPIQEYTANGSSASGSFSVSSQTSPITVTGLTNGTVYGVLVTASNLIGTSGISSTNYATPSVPASTFTFSGPSGGALNTSSGLFSVTVASSFTGTITLTPSGGGLTTPVVLSFP